MACSTCRQRKIKCESNKPNPCKNCQEKGKTCEYMSVADDPKAVTQSQSSPPASSSHSPAYSPPPGTHGRTYSASGSSQRLPPPSSSRAYPQSNWPSSTQYPSYDQGHMQSPSLHDASYGTQAPYSYQLDATQSAAYQASNSYPARSQGILANGLAMPASDFPGTSAAPSNWVSQPSNMHFSGGTYPYHPQHQQQYNSTSQNNAIPGSVQYQGGYPQEQEGYRSSAQENLGQYSSHTGAYQQR